MAFDLARKHLSSTLTLVACSAALAACGPSAGDPGSDETGGMEPELPSWEERRSPRPHIESPELVEDQGTTLVDSQYALATDLFHELRSTEFADKNMALSPYSVQAAFGLVWEIVNEPHFSLIESILHFDLGAEATHPALNWQDARLRDLNLEGIDTEWEKADPVIVAPANGVWATPGVADALPDSYLDTLAAHYDVGIYKADFAADADSERVAINDWVAAKTQGLIDELFKPGVINGGTTMVLVNALYLKAPWSTPFEETLTSTAEFQRLDGTASEVQMMHNREVYSRYAETDDYLAASVPLRGVGLELALIMPTGDYATFEAGLDGPTLRHAVDDMDYGVIDLFMPRFEIDAQTSLKRPLIDLGLETIWGDGGATPAGQFSDVIHSVVIGVDEGGVEAAAATGIVVGESGVEPFPEATLRFDRPFILVLHDTRTSTPLFVGRVLDPTG